MSLALAACATGAWAFPTNVGLFVAGGANGGMNAGGAWARNGGATPYFIEAYNQAAYPTLTGHAQGEWAFTGLLSGPESGATSDASANFGSLGVRTWAWAYDAPHSAFNDHYIFQFGASASATASFFDAWHISAPGQLAGTIGSLDGRLLERDLPRGRAERGLPPYRQRRRHHPPRRQRRGRQRLQPVGPLGPRLPAGHPAAAHRHPRTRRADAGVHRPRRLGPAATQAT